MKKKRLLIACLAAFALCFSAGGFSDAEHASLLEHEAMKQTESGIEMRVNGVVLSVRWEENEAVEALAELLKQGDVTVQTRRYGGFEQVGPLPESLPCDDAQITSVPGDILLYAGDQIVLFFGSNTWAYTRLGHVEAITDEALASLLDTESAVVTFSLPDEKGMPGQS